MTPFRWTLAALSFATAILVSVYIVESSWPAAHALVAVPWLVHGELLVLALLELGARGAKVRLSAAALRLPMTYATALRASAGGDFGAAITPARTGAEPARFLIMTEAGMPSANIILVIFAELFLEMISLALVAAAMFFFIRTAGNKIFWMVGLVAIYAGFVLGIGAFGFALSRSHASGPPPRWAQWLRLHAGRWRAVQRALRQLRDGIHGLRDIRYGIGLLALFASLLHVALRLAILPVIVRSFDPSVSVPPLILAPIALTYGGVIAPLPGGGGAIELAFRATLGTTIPAQYFGASLVWWRFYTFYIFILLGAIAAGGTVLRALREDDEAPDAALAITSDAPAAAASAGVRGGNPGGDGR